MHPAVTVITPTGGRPECMELCGRWMRQQTYTGDIQWLVVDGPDSTLAENLLEAIPQVQHDRVVIVEDDDWYRDDHLDRMVAALDLGALTGSGTTLHYNVEKRMHRTIVNRRHACLHRTALRSDLLPVLEAICAAGTMGIDVRLWRKVPRGDHVREIDPGTVVGIKGMPGRRGMGTLHYSTDGMTADPDGEVLRQWLGDDAGAYLGETFVR